MTENNTRHTQRAAAGLAKAVRHEYTRPDTLIVGPDGQKLILGRPPASSNAVPAFHKYNPARRDARTGKRSHPAAAFKKAKAGAGAAGRGIPFGQLLITAFLVHRVVTFVTRRLWPAKDGPDGGQRQGQAHQGQGQQLVAAGRAGGAAQHGDEEDDLDDEYELDEQQEELLGQMERASMLPAMLRASLPRPQRTNAAKRAAAAYHSRPRGHRTAHQMQHGGAAGAGAAGARKAGGGGGPRRPMQRPMGQLEKMDMLVRQQVHAALMAQQAQAQAQGQGQQQQQRVLLGPGGPATLALPAPPSAAFPHSTGGPADQLALAAPPHAGPGPALPPPHRALGRLPPPSRPLPPELLARLYGAGRAGGASVLRSAAAPPPAASAGVVAEGAAAGAGEQPPALPAAQAAQEPEPAPAPSAPRVFRSGLAARTGGGARGTAAPQADASTSGGGQPGGGGSSSGAQAARASAAPARSPAAAQGGSGARTGPVAETAVSDSTSGAAVAPERKAAGSVPSGAVSCSLGRAQSTGEALESEGASGEHPEAGQGGERRVRLGRSGSVSEAAMAVLTARPVAPEVPPGAVGAARSAKPVLPVPQLPPQPVPPANG